MTDASNSVGTRAASTFSGLIVAAGSGSRASLGQPKQFAMVRGRPLLRWSVEAMLRHPCCHDVTVVVGADQVAAATGALGGLTRIHIAPVGGATRQASVCAGLETIAGHKATQFVLIHDAARPFLPTSVIDRLLLVLESRDGAVPALPIADTLAASRMDGSALGDTIDRDALVRVQTPQAFRFDAILSAHRRSIDGAMTDDAQILRAAGGEVATVTGDRRLEKYTFAADFADAHMIPRIGTGFDVHRLIPGDGVWLCGIHIPHTHSLAGHSDADVALHAITDALLGALAAGDIGDHFPPSDARWKGAASDQFLAHAVNLAHAAFAEIAHVDCTIICEAPKIGPYKSIMRERVAAIMDLPIDRVSIKATTTERLGFTGRGEGIAAEATVTLLR